MSFWDKAGKALQSIAPTIGGLVGGPIGAAGTSLVMEILGLDSGSTPEQINKAVIGMTAEQRIAIAKLDNDFKLQMEQVALQYFQAEASDRDSARKREAEVKDHTNQILAYMIVGSFIALVGASLAGWTKVDSALAGTLVGYISAKAEQILAYYFGSTRQSAMKDNTINKLSAT